MGIEYFELVRKALEYLEVIGGVCAICENSERITTSGQVDCKKYGIAQKPALRCIYYTPRGKYEVISGVQGEIKAEKKEGIQ
jgi:hypothetical protein